MSKRIYIQKNPRVRKIFVRNSGAGNGCANFMDAWKNASVLQEKAMSIKFLVLGGGILGFWGGGKCRFYFYGRGGFSDTGEFAGDLFMDFGGLFLGENRRKIHPKIHSKIRLGASRPKSHTGKICICLFRGFAKEWFPKRWFWQISPVPRFPPKVFPCSATLAEASYVFLIFPDPQNRKEGTLAKTTLLQNHPLVSSWSICVRGSIRPKKHKQQKFALAVPKLLKGALRQHLRAECFRTMGKSAHK